MINEHDNLNIMINIENSKKIKVNLILRLKQFFLDLSFDPVRPSNDSTINLTPPLPSLHLLLHLLLPLLLLYPHSD